MLLRCLLGSCALAVVMMPMTAIAGTIYGFSSGSAVVSATVVTVGGGAAPSPVLLNGSPTLSLGVTGGFIEFDAGAPAIDDFLVQLADTGALALSTTTASDVFGYVSAALTSLQIAPGAGYVGTGVLGGPGNFSFDVGPVVVGGTLFATSGSPPIPPNVPGLPFSQAAPSLAGSLSIGAGMIDLTGVTLGAIVNPLNANEVLVFKGDVVLNGTTQPNIPEPTSALLFAIGGLAAGIRIRRTTASA